MFNTRIHTETVRTSSKIALRLSCLEACGNDIERAAQLYDYIAKDLTLPDCDPVELSGLERVKQGADDVLAWIGSHREEIAQGVTLIKTIGARGGAAQITAADVPPIPNV